MLDTQMSHSIDKVSLYLLYSLTLKSMVCELPEKRCLKERPGMNCIGRNDLQSLTSVISWEGTSSPRIFIHRISIKHYNKVGILGLYILLESTWYPYYLCGVDITC